MALSLQLRITEPRELWRVLDGRRHDGVWVKDKVRGRVGGTRPIRTSEISGTTSYKTESATGCGLTLSFRESSQGVRSEELVWWKETNKDKIWVTSDSLTEFHVDLPSAKSSPSSTSLCNHSHRANPAKVAGKWVRNYSRLIPTYSRRARNSETATPGIEPRAPRRCVFEGKVSYSPAAEETAPARSDTGRDSIPVLCEQRPGRRRREERKEEA
ncbi:hypothetical protein B0H13DRAFT_1849732 [Mycena leptocephala]|nr:hypothetical protein B0H13DRAFT_1849732 [Mycena leptocephala]